MSNSKEKKNNRNNQKFHYLFFYNEPNDVVTWKSFINVSFFIYFTLFIFFLSLSFSHFRKNKWSFSAIKCSQDFQHFVMFNFHFRFIFIFNLHQTRILKKKHSLFKNSNNEIKFNFFHAKKSFLQKIHQKIKIVFKIVYNWRAGRIQC